MATENEMTDYEKEQARLEDEQLEKQAEKLAEVQLRLAERKAQEKEDARLPVMSQMEFFNYCRRKFGW